MLVVAEDPDPDTLTDEAWEAEYDRIHGFSFARSAVLKDEHDHTWHPPHGVEVVLDEKPEVGATVTLTINVTEPAPAT